MSDTVMLPRNDSYPGSQAAIRKKKKIRARTSLSIELIGLKPLWGVATILLAVNTTRERI